MTEKWHPKCHPPRYLYLLYLFIRSADYHQIFTKNLEIYFQTYMNQLEFQYGGKQNGVQNGVHLDICVLLYLFNRSADFHQIFTKNLEIYFQTYRNLLEFQYGKKQNGVQNGVHLDICVYCTSSTVQPIFTKFSPKTLKYISIYRNLLKCQYI